MFSTQHAKEIKTIILMNNPSTFDFARSGKDLIIASKENHVSIIREYFHDSYSEPLANFELPNGMQVPGNMFLLSQNPRINLVRTSSRSSSSTHKEQGTKRYHASQQPFATSKSAASPKTPKLLLRPQSSKTHEASKGLFSSRAKHTDAPSYSIRNYES